jgi:hypothetical protein
MQVSEHAAGSASLDGGCGSRCAVGVTLLLAVTVTRAKAKCHSGSHWQLHIGLPWSSY